MTKAKQGVDMGIKPFVCHKCGKNAMFFDSDKKWYCAMVVGMGTMNSKGYCKNDKEKK
jgi:hypothetical protein